MPHIMLVFFILAVFSGSADSFEFNPCAFISKPTVRESKDPRLRKALASVLKTADEAHKKINIFLCETQMPIIPEIKSTLVFGNKNNFLFIFFPKEAFEFYSEDATEGIIAHELAHIDQRADGSLILYIPTKNELAPDVIFARESPVDIRAAKWVGKNKVISGLETMVRLYEKYADSDLLPLVRQTTRDRIEALKALEK